MALFLVFTAAAVAEVQDKWAVMDRLLLVVTVVTVLHLLSPDLLLLVQVAVAVACTQQEL
jgi:hypothetical protein